jgi:hypothetical protein
LQAIAAFSDGYLLGGYRIIYVAGAYVPAPWLVKVSKTDGSRLWEKTFAPPAPSYGGGIKDLVRVEDDYILAVGHSMGSVWAAKIHTSGAVAWVHRYSEGVGWLEGRAGAFLPSRNRYVIAGHYSEESDDGDALVVELLPDGTLARAVRILKPGRQEVESVAALSTGRIAMAGYGNEIETPEVLEWNLWACGTDGAGLACDSLPVPLIPTSAPEATPSETPISDLSLGVQTVTGDRVVNAAAEDLCPAQHLSVGGGGGLIIGDPGKASG